jgi:hypothetical protein
MGEGAAQPTEQSNAVIVRLMFPFPVRVVIAVSRVIMMIGMSASLGRRIVWCHACTIPPPPFRLQIDCADWIRSYFLPAARSKI